MTSTTCRGRRISIDSLSEEYCDYTQEPRLRLDKEVYLGINSVLAFLQGYCRYVQELLLDPPSCDIDGRERGDLCCCEILRRRQLASIEK